MDSQLTPEKNQNSISQQIPALLSDTISGTIAPTQRQNDLKAGIPQLQDAIIRETAIEKADRDVSAGKQVCYAALTGELSSEAWCEVPLSRRSFHRFSITIPQSPRNTCCSKASRNPPENSYR
uniref:Uncharacterized protein n=1 Tax=Physcomitrium patens TaxID=3218 RepID=A0A2K1IY54_PHYPA|nr:hypothetical protein PHYPA_024020 [Physcomitrium patens]